LKIEGKVTQANNEALSKGYLKIEGKMTQANKNEA
jgi:hypothetical protein